MPATLPGRVEQARTAAPAASAPTRPRSETAGGADGFGGNPASALGAARAHRRLSVEEAAARADLDPETIRSLEEGRVYRFESTQAALAAALLYATSLGVTGREARRLVGLPVPPRGLDVLRSGRALAAVAFLGTLGALAWFAIVPRLGEEPAPAAAPSTPAPPAAPAQAALPPPWQIEVAVYNGSAEPNAAARMADRIAGLAYRIGAVADASRRDYPSTEVFYAPGGEAVADRLARQLGVTAAALPGGDDPKRLVVIVGAG